MDTLLIIDDEPGVHLAFRHAFPARGLTLLGAESAREGRELFERHRPSAVVIDLDLPGDSGPELVRMIQKQAPGVPVLVVTRSRSTDSAIESIKLGAFDFLIKPIDPAMIRPIVERALQVARMIRQVGDGRGEGNGDGENNNARLPPGLIPNAPSEPADGVLIGCGPAMQRVYKAIGRVAPTDVTVLIRGESGSGKELVARAIHQHSQRADRPFLAVNCAAIPEGLIESTLFGHEAGAFTGADSRRVGMFEQADGGTLMLDEIGDLSPMAQAKVLRALQEGTFERVGGVKTIRVDVRLIAATHRDLRALADQGRFRQDLFYRLNVFCLMVPPLRKRPEDLPALVMHFLRRDRDELGRDVRFVDPGTIDCLRSHDWPGNVRELQSVLKQAILHCHGPVLLPEFLPEPIGLDGPGRDGLSLALARSWDGFVASRLDDGSTAIYDEALAEMERQVIGRVLRHTGGNQLRASRLLGITRGTLRTKIRALGLSTDLTPGPRPTDPGEGPGNPALPST